MRLSLEGLPAFKDNYEGLPEELKEFNYYIIDGETGHAIMAVPECLLEEAEEEGADLIDYELPISCKYILQNGYKMYKGHVIVDVEYSHELGLILDDEWFEM